MHPGGFFSLKLLKGSTMAFDTRKSVEERYRDEVAPMSQQERREYDSVNLSIDVFGWLVVASGLIGFAMVVIGTIEHFNR